MTDSLKNKARRDLLASSAALIGSSVLPAASGQAHSQQISASPKTVPQSPPSGFNILFILVDQEHFFQNGHFPSLRENLSRKKRLPF